MAGALRRGEAFSVPLRSGERSKAISRSCSGGVQRTHQRELSKAKGHRIKESSSDSIWESEAHRIPPPFVF